MPVKCEICGYSDPIQIIDHLRNEHDLTVSDYQSKHSGSEVLCPSIKNHLENSKIYVDSSGIPRRLVKFNGHNTYGPVFPHDTSPELDKNYVFNDSLVKTLCYAFEANLRVLLVGPPGTGKTSLIQNMCAVLGWGFRRVNFNGQTTPRTLFGSPRISPSGETYFLYGSVPLAMKNGECLLLDEISFIDPDMAAGLHEVLEVGGKLTLLENEGEVIIPHQDFRIFATDNVGAAGDYSGEYTGTKLLNSAFIDRWNLHLKIDFLTSEEEKNVLRGKIPSLPESFIDKMCYVASISRGKSSDFKHTGPQITLRQLMSWGQMIVYGRSCSDAFKITICNRYDEENANLLSFLYSHVFASIGGKETMTYNGSSYSSVPF